MKLPFPEIELPQSKPFNSAEVLAEHHKKEALRKAADEKLIEPYKDQIEKIYTQTWCIDRAMLKMEKAGVPLLVRQTWFIIEANRVKKAVMIKRITSH